MSRSSTLRGLAMLATGLLALGACGGDDEDASSSGTTRIEGSTTSSAGPATTGGGASSTSAPPPTSSVAGTERLTADSRLRLDGIGPVKVSMTLEQASAATGMRFHQVEPDLGTDCRYAEAEGSPVGLRFMVIGGHIARVDVSDHPSPSPIATVSGIRIGSTEDEVKAAYPDAIEVTPHPYLETGHYLVLKSDDPALGLIFETDGQRVTRFRSGLAGAVQQIEGCA